MDRLGSALDNLALAATNDKTVPEQLTAANLALTGTIATLTATNKKLADKARAGTAGTQRTPGRNTFGTCFGETGLKIRPDVFHHDNCEQKKHVLLCKMIPASFSFLPF